MPKCYSLYKIIKQINPVAYYLQLPKNMRIYNIFHVDLLSPYKIMEAYGEYDWDRGPLHKQMLAAVAPIVQQLLCLGRPAIAGSFKCRS
jgi:hypothetical protein